MTIPKRTVEVGTEDWYVRCDKVIRWMCPHCDMENSQSDDVTQYAYLECRHCGKACQAGNGTD